MVHASAGEALPNEISSAFPTSVHRKAKTKGVAKVDVSKDRMHVDSHRPWSQAADDSLSLFSEHLGSAGPLGKQSLKTDTIISSPSTSTGSNGFIKIRLRVCLHPCQKLSNNQDNQDPPYLPSGGSTIIIIQSCDVEEPSVHVDSPTWNPRRFGRIAVKFVCLSRWS